MILTWYEKYSINILYSYLKLNRESDFYQYTGIEYLKKKNILFMRKIYFW